MIRCICTALLILIFSQPSNCQTGQKEALKVFKAEDYIISYPTSLKLDNDGTNGLQFILFTEKDTEDDDFIENINLVSQDLTSMDIDLDGFVEITRNELQDVGEIVESERIMAKGYEYHRMVYTYTQNGIQLTFLQHGLIANNTLYMLTFSAKSDSFEEYYLEMEQVMLSFTPL